MRYHLVKCAKPEKVAKYIRPCPARTRDAGAPVRFFMGENLYCTNFIGSAQALRMIREQNVEFKEIEQGCFVADFKEVYV